MTVYFLDEFNGSGPLNGHVPDINLASGAAWVPAINNSGPGYSGGGNSGTAWAADTNATISGGSLVAIGSASCTRVNMLSPGFGPGAPQPRGFYLLPPEVYTHEPFKLSWSWTPQRDSSQPLFRDGLNIGVGTTATEFFNSAGATKTLVFGDSLVPVSYAAGVTYNGSIEVRVDEQTLQFMGQTLVYSGTGDLLTDLAFGIISITLDSGNAINFIKVESLTPNLFWTSKVGCTES